MSYLILEDKQSPEHDCYKNQDPGGSAEDGKDGNCAGFEYLKMGQVGRGLMVAFEHVQTGNAQQRLEVDWVCVVLSRSLSMPLFRLPKHLTLLGLSECLCTFGQRSSE